ncbi:MAG: hypothetical protein QM743_05160 [Chitinophagaceae bacterium]
MKFGLELADIALENKAADIDAI